LVRRVAQDTVGVQAGDRLDHGGDLGGQLPVPGRSPGRVQLGVEAGFEQPHQGSGDAAVREQHVHYIVLAVRAAGLAQVAHVGAQHRRLPPVQPGPQHQGVEPVHLAGTPPGRDEGVLEAPLHVLDVLAAQPLQHDVAQAQAEVVDPARHTVSPDHLIGTLIDDLDAHPLQHRQHLGQRDPLPRQVELEPPLPRLGLRGQVETQIQAVLPGQRLQPADVDQRGGGVEVLLVGLREGRQIALREVGTHPVGTHPVGTHAAGTHAAGVHGVEQPVVPGAHGALETFSDRRDVGCHGNLRVAGVGVHSEMHPRVQGLADPGVVLQAGAVQFVQQHVLHGQPGRGGVPVARQVDQAGEEPAVGVAPAEQPQRPPLGKRQHPGHRPVQRVRVGGEQLGPRVGLHHFEHPLPRVGIQGHPGAVDHLEHLPADHRDVQHVLVQCGGGEDAEKAVLSGGLAALVEGLDPDVVRVDGAVHGGGHAGLGEHQQIRRQRVGQVRPGAEAARGETVSAQHAEPGSEHRPQCRRGPAGPVLDEFVVPVAEESEMSRSEPAQQRGALGDLLGGKRGRRGVQFVGQRVGSADHPPGVLDDLAHISEHGEQAFLHLTRLLLIGDAIDFHVYPGLDQRIGGCLVRIGVGDDLPKCPGEVAADHHDRVYETPHPEADTDQLGDHGVHQVGHVVGDDLHHGAHRMPPVPRPAGVEQPDHRAAGHSVSGQFLM
jgi:hypothetical protein